MMGAKLHTSDWNNWRSHWRERTDGLNTDPATVPHFPNDCSRNWKDLLSASHLKTADLPHTSCLLLSLQCHPALLYVKRYAAFAKRVHGRICTAVCKGVRWQTKYVCLSNELLSLTKHSRPSTGIQSGGTVSILSIWSTPIPTKPEAAALKGWWTAQMKLHEKDGWEYLSNDRVEVLNGSLLDATHTVTKISSAPY